MEENRMAEGNSIWQIDEASENYIDNFQLHEIVDNPMNQVADKAKKVEKKSKPIRDFFHDCYTLFNMYR